MNRILSINNIKYYLILLILIFIGFQQVLVLRIGGSFKLYELAALILLFFNLIYLNKTKMSIESFLLFIFLIISPIFSLLTFYFHTEDINSFYHTYSNAKTFRYNYAIAPIIILVYFIFNWVSVNEIIHSYRIYINRKKL